MDHLIIEPHVVSEPVGLVSSELSTLSTKAGDVDIFGGLSEESSRGWIACDSTLDIICSKTGNRLSSFNFSQVAGSSSTITCVKDYWCQGTFQLLVGLRTSSDRGMVCRFHPHTSKLLTAVTFPHMVTSIEPVTSVGGVDAPNFALSDELRRFFGIIAVGTKGGHVYLLDLRLDEEEEEFWDRARAHNAQFIASGDSAIDQRRMKASARDEHLCLDLNGDNFSYYSFNYCKPDGSIFKSFPIGDVTVTSLHYISQIGSLAVGFNFGCFQLWRLLDTSLEYSGPLSRQPSPVTHFAYQEPEDDPQYFCYLWVGRGPLPSDAREQEVLTDIHLFQLAYEKKTQHAKHGHVFKDLVDCIGRFEHCLTADPLDSDEVKSWGSRLLSCYTLSKELAHGVKAHDDSSFEEEVNPTDLSLAVFVWEACPSGSDSQDNSCHYIALFDLNRYYHAQMPAFLKSSELREPIPYFSFYNLESVVESALPDFTLNVHLDKGSLTKYQSIYQPVPEQHFHPSSLSFNIVCLAEGSLVHASYLGIQRKILADMFSQGSTLLRDPRPCYLRCWNAHLIPRRNLHEQMPANISTASQREAILTLALEHNLLGFLVACVSSWSQGDFTSGLNLRSILEWAWGKVASIKQGVDEMCVPLYDGYGTFIDSQTYRMLETYSTQLCHMVTLFQALLDQSGTTTEQGVKDLETKLAVVTLISKHLQMVLWFARSGLLPECADEIGSPLEGQFRYPASLLRQTYAQRRAELARLCKNSGNSDIMLIDGLVSEAGPALVNLWDRKEEGGTGTYPPPTLHALLDIYLLENVSLATKHCIVGYLLLDIISVVSDSKHAQMVSKIEQFHQVFSLPLGLTKLLQAFWLLDHRDYGEALAMLLEPNTNNDLLSWQHTRIVKTFLYHNQAKMALQYVRCVKPTLDTPDDVKLHLTVLLANGLTAEAFQFQREYRDPSTMDDLLYHIFLGSQQTKTMDQLLRLPFDDCEESMLVRYLQESMEPNSKELLVMHYLQRTRFVDAVRLNETLKQQALMGDNDPLARERTSARNIITESYLAVLPKVQRRLAFESDARHRKQIGIRREVPRPKPLSTIINPAKSSKVISHALLLNAVLDRIAEARNVIRADETPTKLLDDTFEGSPYLEPFVGTPMTPRNVTARSEDVSVVYPETITAEESAPYQPHMTSLNLSINQSLRGLSSIETPKSLKEHFKRPPLDYSGAEALSLLQTPPVKRRIPSVKQEETVAPPTPQSILKVRRVIRRSPSPPKLKMMERTQGAAAINITMPTPPTFHRKTLSFADDEDDKEIDQPKPPTPGRHIRFSDDTISPESPSPEIDLLPDPPTFSPKRETPSPTVESPVWGTPPISPDTSPTKVETPPFQSPQETEGPLPQEEMPCTAESPRPKEFESGHKILTPTLKPPTPRQLSPMQPSLRQQSLMQPSLRQTFPPREELEVLPVPMVDEDSSTPPIPEGMQISFTPGGEIPAGQEEEEDEEDVEITFNFNLRHSIAEEDQLQEDVGDADVAMATRNVEMDDGYEDMETEVSPSQEELLLQQTSSELPPSFLFQASPRQPIHPLSPFQFQDGVSPKDIPGTSAQPPSPLQLPPQQAEDLQVEQAFLETSPSEDQWKLTFEGDTEDEDQEPEPVPEPVPEQSTVRFGGEEVFEIPPAVVPRHVQESVEIQTSPMIGHDLIGQRGSTTEISVQTTPGLALRRQIEKTPPRVPFGASLQTSEVEEGAATAIEGDQFQVTAPVEVELPPQQEPSPQPEPAQARTPPRSSPRLREREKKKQEESSTPAQPSFIFSPPLTRSRGRRSARKTIVAETSALSAAQPSETTITLQSPAPGVSITPMTGTSGRRTGRRSRTPKTASTPLTQIKDKPTTSPGRGSRRTPLPAQVQSPSANDSVVLVSPGDQEAESEPKTRTLRRNPRRAVRIAPHSMTLRTPSERKIRKVKPW